MNPWAVRAALKLMSEDPPMELGRTELARELIPWAMDNRRRGEVLQHALRTAIDRLTDRPWAYLIYIGEYEEGKSQGEIRRALSISLSTYGRAKKWGLHQIIGQLPHIIATHPLTDGERELILRRLLGEGVLRAMDKLRSAVKTGDIEPVLRAFEDVMAEQVNHLYSVCGTLVVGPIERLEERLDRLEGNAQRAVGD